MNRIVLSIFLFLSSYTTAVFSQVDLHAHPFMDKGMGAFFKGKFFSPLKAKNHKKKLASKLNAESLEKSGVRVFVASLYAHPLLVARPFETLAQSMRRSIRDQIQQAHEFVRKYPNWIIARNSKDTQAALAQGKKVIVLSLEGPHKILETESGLREFIDYHGISIVTLSHLVDNKFAGSSYMKGVRKKLFTKYWFTRKKKNGIKVNPTGLKEKGHWLVKELIKRGVWIDLSHSSDQAVLEMLPYFQAAKLPLLYTHTSLRHFHGAERAIPAWQLKHVKAMGGFVGLVPSPEMLNGVKTGNGPCHKDITALKTQIDILGKEIGYKAISLGTDFNGGIPHLPPTGCHNNSLSKKGLLSMAQWPELSKSLSNMTDGWDARVAESHFLFLWSKLR